MLVRKLIETRASERVLHEAVRAAMVRSLFAPIASLAIGAVGCGIAAAVVAVRADDGWITACSVAIGLLGLARVHAAVVYNRRNLDAQASLVRFWERVYELGAWCFALLLGLLCLLTVHKTDDAALHLLVSTTTAGYAAGIAGRNAARPVIAIGQLALAALPLAAALLARGELAHATLGLVVVLFVYGMSDIALSVHGVVLKALTASREAAALAARFREQAAKFDVALNNMSHGLCMFDDAGSIRVWNDRLREMLRMPAAELRVGVEFSRIARLAVRNGLCSGDDIRRIVASMSNTAPDGPTTSLLVTCRDDRILSLSYRPMENGGRVVTLEDVTEHRAAQDRIRRLAHFDELTGLPNRARFHECMDEILKLVRIQKRTAALHLIDLDRFKTVNDTLGHPIGDRLLQEVSRRIEAVVPPGTTIARLGGDEFVILQSAGARRATARKLAEKLVNALSTPFGIDGHRIDIGASVGIALTPSDALDADQLLTYADMALYVAKAEGAGCYRFFAHEMAIAAQSRRFLELKLREAIQSRRFRLYFQPLVNLRSGEVTACEALLRWPDEQRGFIPPSDFIPIAEDTGLIVTLGAWVLTQACTEASAWPPGVKLAVNLSPVQFTDAGLVETVRQALASSGLPPARLELEITERVLLKDEDATRGVVDRLRALGVGISLDDFGTGYSSLNYLRTLSFTKIKIDRSFVQGPKDGHDAAPIIRAIARLGADMNMTVVAEGIETRQHLDLVRSEGCDEGQGYFLGRPVCAAEIAGCFPRARETLVA